MREALFITGEIWAIGGDVCFLFRRSESTKEKPVAFGLFLDMLLEFRRFRKLYIGSSDCFLSPLIRSKSQRRFLLSVFVAYASYNLN